MPFRSPKMYFAIFGFHRLVWWPKWTPASSSSFIVIWDIPPPWLRFSPPRPGLRPFRASPPMPGRVRDRASAGARVYLNVVLRQVAGPHVVVPAAQPEVHHHRDVVLGQLGLHPLPADPVL